MQKFCLKCVLYTVGLGGIAILVLDISYRKSIILLFIAVLLIDCSIRMF